MRFAGRRTMTGCESMFENDIQWVLYASQALGGIIVFIMDMNVVVHDGVANILREEVVVDEWLGSFRSKLHHHAGWCVGIHVGVLTGNVVVLGSTMLMNTSRVFALRAILRWLR